jgi:hypothetical protein
MVCWIPRMPDLEHRCPHSIVCSWLTVWDRCFGDAAESPLFCVTGRPGARPASYDCWRKALAAFFCDRSVGTHSLRKGGAQWFRNVLGVREDVVQSQGGWSSLEVMRRVYAEVPVSARRSLLVGAARASVGACAAPAAGDDTPEVPPPVVTSAPSDAAPSRVATVPVWELVEHVQCDACFTWHSVDESVADRFSGDAVFRCEFIGQSCSDVVALD